MLACTEVAMVVEAQVNTVRVATLIPAAGGLGNSGFGVARSGNNKMLVAGSQSVAGRAFAPLVLVARLACVDIACMQ